MVCILDEIVTKLILSPFINNFHRMSTGFVVISPFIGAMWGGGPILCNFATGEPHGGVLRASQEVCRKRASCRRSCRFSCCSVSTRSSSVSAMAIPAIQIQLARSLRARCRWLSAG